VKKIILAAALAASAISPAAAQAQTSGAVLECGAVPITRAVWLVNLTTRSMPHITNAEMCNVARIAAPNIFRASEKHGYLSNHAFWSITVRRESADTIANTGVWYDERATTGPLVVRFQVYFE
jgi:hypothetical protein